MSDKQGGDLGQAAKDAGRKAEHGAQDAGRKVEHGAQDAAHSAQDAGSKAQDRASSAVNNAEKKADRQGARPGGNKNKADKDNLKVAGAAVAVAAALVFGGVKVYKSRQSDDQPNKARDKAEEKTGGAFNWFSKKADHASKKADSKAPDAKNKAAELTDNVVASVKGAAENTKSGLNEAAHSVSSGTKDARNKLENERVKLEDKGLKASQDSDRAVREAYFNAEERAHRVTSSGRDKAKHGKEKGGNIFDSIGNWFNDRKDDASHAAGSAKRQVQDAGKKGKK